MEAKELLGAENFLGAEISPKDKEFK